MKNKNRTYLTIGLNSWADTTVDEDWILEVLKHVASADVAASVWPENLLAHAHRYAHCCTRLINMSPYSDLAGGWESYEELEYAGFRRLELHSGSWVDYVDWNRKERYVWAHPRRKDPCRGRCDHFSPPDVPFSEIPQRKDVAWKSLQQYCAMAPDYGIKLDEIKAVAIVLSPADCSRAALPVFRRLVEEYGLELLDCLPENLTWNRLKVERGFQEPVLEADRSLSLSEEAAA